MAPALAPRAFHSSKHRTWAEAVSLPRASSALIEPPKSLALRAREQEGRLTADSRYGPRLDVFGYPATWPAGPWILPLFWFTVLLGAWLLRWLG
jgi:hypothetical protein